RLARVPHARCARAEARGGTRRAGGGAMSGSVDPARLRSAVLPLAFVLMAALAWPLRDYITDDTYIHLQYAHHLAAGDGFVFNTGERVYGSTSPLWVLLIADLMAMGVDGLLASKLLGGAATL